MFCTPVISGADEATRCARKEDVASIPKCHPDVVCSKKALPGQAFVTLPISASPVENSGYTVYLDIFWIILTYFASCGEVLFADGLLWDSCSPCKWHMSQSLIVGAGHRRPWSLHNFLQFHEDVYQCQICLDHSLKAVSLAFGRRKKTVTVHQSPAETLLRVPLASKWFLWGDLQPQGQQRYTQETCEQLRTFVAQQRADWCENRISLQAHSVAERVASPLQHIQSSDKVSAPED